jgi:putative hydrolase of the HAD superfamily
MEDRHHLTFETYEEEKTTPEEYLDRAVFYQKQPFTPGNGFARIAE